MENKAFDTRYRLISVGSTDLLLAPAKAISQNNCFIVTFYFSGGGPYKYEIHDDKNNNGARDDGEEIESVSLLLAHNPGLESF